MTIFNALSQGCVCRGVRWWFRRTSVTSSRKKSTHKHVTAIKPSPYPPEQSKRKLLKKLNKFKKRSSKIFSPQLFFSLNFLRYSRILLALMFVHRPHHSYRVVHSTLKVEIVDAVEVLSRFNLLHQLSRYVFKRYWKLCLGQRLEVAQALIKTLSRKF